MSHTTNEPCLCDNCQQDIYDQIAKEIWDERQNELWEEAAELADDDLKEQRHGLIKEYFVESLQDAREAIDNEIRERFEEVIQSHVPTVGGVQ